MLPPAEDDVKRAKELFDCEDGIMAYIVNPDISIESATKAEADAMHAEVQNGRLEDEKQ